jgi:adenylate cyclase
VRAGMVAELLPVRLVAVGVIGAVFASTWHPIFLRYHSWILAGGALFAASGIVVMMAMVGTRMQVALNPNLAVGIVGTFTMFRIRFPVALGAALLMFAEYTVTLATGEYPFEGGLVSIFLLVTALLVGAFAGWNIEHYARQGFLARKGLEAEQERSERLLLNVLPAPIAERLKVDPAPIADRFSEASVLFADIVDFTRLSGGMTPEDLVTLLNELFTDFDRVAERHGLEKIKTMGDAYMAVCGVPLPRPDHLERIADAALEMRDVVAARAESGRRPLGIRIGIDTGPVVAGVIGEKKFIYDLWGDPVTLASRMQSHGLASEIQLTARAGERLTGRYALTPRGAIEVKGRGRMETYLLGPRIR